MQAGSLLYCPPVLGTGHQPGWVRCGGTEWSWVLGSGSLHWDFPPSSVFSDPVQYSGHSLGQGTQMHGYHCGAAQPCPHPAVGSSVGYLCLLFHFDVMAFHSFLLLLPNASITTVPRGMGLAQGGGCSILSCCPAGPHNEWVAPTPRPASGPPGCCRTEEEPRWVLSAGYHYRAYSEVRGALLLLPTAAPQT